MTSEPRPSWEDIARVNALLLEHGIRTLRHRDHGAAPAPAMVALARLVATTVPDVAVRLPALLAVAGPQTAAAVARLARIEAQAAAADATAGGGRGGPVSSSPGLAAWTSTSDAARLIGVAHADSVRAAIRRGRLAGRKDPAGRWLVDPGSIEAYRRRRDGAAGHAAWR